MTCGVLVIHLAGSLYIDSFGLYMVGSIAFVQHFEGEQHVIEAAKHVMKALEANNNLTDDFRKLLADVDTHLSTMSIVAETTRGLLSNVEEQLKHAESKVWNWESNQIMISESGPREKAEYLQVVDDIQRLIDSLGSVSLSGIREQMELSRHAQFVLQIAMERLEDELIHILFHKKQSFGGQYISSSSCREDVVNDNESLDSTEYELVHTASVKSSEWNTYEYMVDLVHPAVIPDLKSIANVMFGSHYDLEFREAYVSARKDTLAEYLDFLNIDELAIDDVLRLDSSNLNHIIRRWIRAMKILIRVYLSSEKWLCEQILGKFGPVHSVCFIEISKVSMLCLLNFGEAIAMVPHPPDCLFSLLDMYDDLGDLLLNLDTLFSVDAGSFIRTEFKKLLKRVGDSARIAVRGFQNDVSSSTSTTPFPQGGVHPLTKYVMNYITTLAAYGYTLNTIYQEHTEETTDTIEPEYGEEIHARAFCPAAIHLHSIALDLQTNLCCKSDLYKDDSLKHIFLMNNINYMVEKVKCSADLKTFIGDEWIKAHIVQLQQHARSYERETWNPVISLLKEDVRSSLKALTNAPTKQRLKRFSLAFDEIYNVQIGWSVPDLELRKELQTSIALILIPAYRHFEGRNCSSVPERYIKYTDDDLELCLLDLFEGTPRSLNRFLRK